MQLNNVICGDAATEMAKMEAGSVDLVVTSPPYNLRNSTGIAQGYEGHDDFMAHAEYIEWQRECLEQCMRLLPETGAIFYNHKWRVQGGLLQDRNDIVAGFPVRQVIIWWRGSEFNFNSGYFVPTYEVIYLICKKKFALAPKANALGDVWKILPDRDNSHPAPFPLEVPQRCIRSTTAQVVLDPFCGSGTTLVAAKQLGRSYIGIDKSPSYVHLALSRIDVTTSP